MSNIANKPRSSSGVFGMSLVFAFILFFLALVAAIFWTQTLEPFHVQVNKTIFATEVVSENMTTIKERPLSYPETVFQSAYAVSYKKASENINLTGETTHGTASGMKKEEGFRLLKAEKAKIPIQYTEIQYPYMEYPVYAFMDTNGVIQYRVYAERIQNNEEERGYLVSTQAIENMRIQMKYDEKSAFIRLEDEPFGIITAENAPDEKTIGLMKEYGKTGTYYRNTNGGTKEYYVYGHYKDEPSEFYLADSTGTMIPGTLPLVNINNKEDK